MGAGPGSIFPPVDGGSVGFTFLLCLGIVALVIASLWLVGVLSYVSSVIAMMIVVASIISFIFVIIQTAIDSYHRRWPLG